MDNLVAAGLRSDACTRNTKVSSCTAMIAECTSTETPPNPAPGENSSDGGRCQQDRALVGHLAGLTRRCGGCNDEAFELAGSLQTWAIAQSQEKIERVRLEQQQVAEDRAAAEPRRKEARRQLQQIEAARPQKEKGTSRSTRCGMDAAVPKLSAVVPRRCGTTLAHCSVDRVEPQQALLGQVQFGACFCGWAT